MTSVSGYYGVVTSLDHHCPKRKLPTEREREERLLTVIPLRSLGALTAQRRLFTRGGGGWQFPAYFPEEEPRQLRECCRQSRSSVQARESSPLYITYTIAMILNDSCIILYEQEATKLGVDMRVCIGAGRIQAVGRKRKEKKEKRKKKREEENPHASRGWGTFRVRLSLYLYRIPSSTLLFTRCHVQLRKIKD